MLYFDPVLFFMKMFIKAFGNFHTKIEITTLPQNKK